MSRIRSPFSALVIEASLAMAYDTWVGPTYLSTWAGTLGIAKEDLPWLTSLPALGSVGQCLGVLLFMRLARNRSVSLKGLCITLTLFARSLWFLPWIASTQLTIKDSSPSVWISGIGGLAALSSAVGMTSASFWMAWMRDLIPHAEEGRFWGWRSLWATVGVISAHLISMVWLEMNQSPSAFQVLLLLALLSAGGSVLLLSRIPATHRPHSSKPLGPLFLKLLQPEYREILIFTSLFQGSMCLAGPYFPYYFTHEVGLPPSTVAFWSLMSQAGVWVSSFFWGKRLDLRSGVAFEFAGKSISVLRFSVVLMSLSPLPYMISDPSILKWIGPGEYFINGVASAGYAIAVNTLIFQRTRDSSLMSMVLFSALTSFQGILSAGSAWIGSSITQVVPAGGFPLLWVIASAARLAVVTFFLPRSLVERSRSAL